MSNYYGGQDVGESSKTMVGISGRLTRMTQTEQLEEKKKVLDFELARVNAALEALKANPEIEKILNLVQQAL